MPDDDHIDDLDTPITEFLAAVSDRLSINEQLRTLVAAIEKPESRDKTARKRYLNEVRAAYEEVLPGLHNAYSRISSDGSTIWGLTDDENITGPVAKIVELVSQEAADLAKLLGQMENALSAMGGLVFVVSFLAAGVRGLPRQEQIEKAATNLTAYYLMQMRPSDE